MKKSGKSNETVEVRLVKSLNGRLASHKSCVRGLGLRKIGQTVKVINTRANWGLIDKANYLLQVEGERPCS